MNTNSKPKIIREPIKARARKPRTTCILFILLLARHHNKISNELFYYF
jgi:hypothetical protein